jgi:hypothetical protein
MSAWGRRVAFVLLAANAALVTGCFTMAKQAYSEVRGAQGELLPIREMSAAALARYQSVDFTPATTTVGARICPPAVLRAYDRSANQLAARLRQQSYPGGVPSLRIDSDVLYFQGKGLLSGALMLTRVRMLVGDELVGDTLVKAESNSFRAGGEGDLAKASLDALARLLDKTRRTGTTPPAIERDRDAEK